MLDRKTFLVKERVGLLKLVDTYDILDAGSGARIGIAREQVSPLIKLSRLLLNKRMLPTAVEVRESEGGPLVLSMRRGFTLLRSRVTVHDPTGRQIGCFRSKVFSLGGAFHVLDASDNVVAEVAGDWKGWNFRFRTAEGTEIGTVTKKWAGLGKELFTTADNYVIALTDGRMLPPDSVALLLAAGLAIDIVFKEH